MPTGLPTLITAGPLRPLSLLEHGHHWSGSAAMPFFPRSWPARAQAGSPARGRRERSLPARGPPGRQSSGRPTRGARGGTRRGSCRAAHHHLLRHRSELDLPVLYSRRLRRERKGHLQSRLARRRPPTAGLDAVFRESRAQQTSAPQQGVYRLFVVFRLLLGGSADSRRPTLPSVNTCSIRGKGFSLRSLGPIRLPGPLRNCCAPVRTGWVGAEKTGRIMLRQKNNLWVSVREVLSCRRKMAWSL